MKHLPARTNGPQHLGFEKAFGHYNFHISFRQIYGDFRQVTDYWDLKLQIIALHNQN